MLSESYFFEGAHIPPYETTTLYGLPPKDIGLSTAESLRSYFFRLADAHNVSPNEFSKWLARQVPNGYKRRVDTIFFRRRKGQSGWVTGVDRDPLELASALSTLTGRLEILYTTFSWCRGLVSGYLLDEAGPRFCPACFGDVHHPREVHEPLVWSIKAVTVCPIHRVRLIAQVCGAPKSKHLNRGLQKAGIGWCTTCGAIAYRCTSAKQEIGTDSENWAAEQVADLIASFASGPPPTLAMFKGHLAALVERATGGNMSALAEQAGLPKSSLHRWLRMRLALPSLPGLLQLAGAANVTLASVFRGEFVPLTPPSRPWRYASRMSAIRSTKASLERRRHALYAAVLSETPPSGAKLARSLGIDRKLLRIGFPAEYAQLMRRRRDFLTLRKAERSHAALREYEHVRAQLREQKLPLTLRNAGFITGDTWFPKQARSKFLIADRARDSNARSGTPPAPSRR